MEENAHILDYEGLVELAKSQKITVVEADDLGESSGIHFSESGSEWITLASGLSPGEKARTLGFLLRDGGKSTASGFEAPGKPPAAGQPVQIHSLRCPTD